ncbi:hypothetical protein [Nocardia sp. NPDC050406]|uniref:hypothetical protein n=1 Tax=Nocardia sp. NPDC050406 TaxID=3364318 RepID=UPI00378880B5
MSGDIAALTIPAAAYWVLFGLPVLSATAGLLLTMGAQDADDYRSRYFGELQDLLDIDNSPTFRIICALLGNAVLFIALIALVVRAAPADLPAAAVLGALLLLLTLALLGLAIWLDDMPWRYAAFQAMNWTIKLVGGTVVITMAIRCPETLY